MVCFASAADGVRAALAAQHAFASDARLSAHALRVRIGLHTGTPLLTSEGYVGLDVHRAARVRGAAYGGQVLLSGSTVAALGGVAIAGIDFLDLGSHRFKGLGQPERLYQLLAEGLPEHFPPPLGTRDAAGVLPVHPTSIVGREGELRALFDLLGRREMRLITLSGPGGTGKTRLALEAASQAALRFADGVFFVPLDSVREPAGVVSAIARALELPSSEEGLGAITGHLAENRQLLLLDNFEQVLEAAPLMAELLAACPGTKLLVTSREPLSIRGEREFPVAPLGLPGGRDTSAEQIARSAAVRLFVERAAGVKPGFALTAANASAVAAICTRLDGLPLAIELVAARSKLLRPEALLSRLDDALGLAVHGARDLPERHQSLRAAIAWSYDLLPVEEQTVFRHCAVFAGGFTFESAEAVVPAALGGASLLDRVEALVAKSLLRASETADGDPRFTIYETIREFGLEQLEAAGEAEEARTRHLTWFRKRALESWLNEPQQDNVTWLTSEETNLRDVLRWATDHPALAALGLSLATAAGTFWWQRSAVEGVEWITGLLAKAPDISPNARSRALYWKAFLSMEWASPADVVLIAESCLSEARRIEGSASTLTLALNVLGDALIKVRDHARARRCCDEAVATARALGDPSLVALTLGPCGLAAYARGDFDTARACWHESCDRFRAIGDTLLVASPLHWLAQLELRLGQWAEAERLLSQCAGYLRGTGDLPRLPQTLSLLAEIRIAQGNRDAARALVRDAIDSTEAAAMPPIAAALITSARLASLSGRWEEAAILLTAARTHAREREGQMLDWERAVALEGDAARHLGRAATLAAGHEGRGLSRSEALRRARKATFDV